LLCFPSNAASAAEIAASTETVGLDEANDAEEALSFGAEPLGEYSQGFTNECPNETTLLSLNATFATAFTKGMFSCENYTTMSCDGERLIRRYSHAAVGCMHVARCRKSIQTCILLCCY
jgi:hypothetical protein